MKNKLKSNLVKVILILLVIVFFVLTLCLYLIWSKRDTDDISVGQTIDLDDFDCVTDKYYGKNDQIGTWNKTTNSYFEDYRFLCRGGQFYSCTDLYAYPPNVTRIWNSFSTIAPHGSKLGKYYCNNQSGWVGIDAKVSKWVYDGSCSDYKPQKARQKRAVFSNCSGDVSTCKSVNIEYQYIDCQWQSLGQDQITCETADYYGKNGFVGLWNKDMSYHSDDRFICMGGNMYRCTNNAVDAGTLAYWNTMSFEANEGQTVGYYKCDLDNGWVERSANEDAYWELPFVYMGDVASDRSGSIVKDYKQDTVWTYIPKDSILKSFSFERTIDYDKAKHGDVCLSIFHLNGPAWTAGMNKEFFCMNYSQTIKNPQVNFTSGNINLFVPAGTWLACGSFLQTSPKNGKYPEEHSLLRCEVDIETYDSYIAKDPNTVANRTYRFPPVDQTLIDTGGSYPWSMPKLYLRSTNDFPVKINSFSAFYATDKSAPKVKVRYCLKWLDKDKKEKDKYCVDRNGNADTVAWSQFEMMPSMWKIPEGEYLTATCAYDYPDGGVGGDCIIYAYVDIPKDSRRLSYTFGAVQTFENAIDYCYSKSMYKYATVTLYENTLTKQQLIANCIESLGLYEGDLKIWDGIDPVGSSTDLGNDPIEPEGPFEDTDDPTKCAIFDINDDLKVNIIDFIIFKRLYNVDCDDSTAIKMCKSMDTNGNDKLDVVDFVAFKKVYGKECE